MELDSPQHATSPRASRARRLAPRIAGAGLAAGCVAWATGLVGGSGPIGPERASAADLTPFDSCGALLDYVDEHRWAQDRYGGGIPIPLAGGAVLEDAAVAADASAGLAPAVGPGESGTNVQEAGVDEPDMAKLSGETLFVAARNGVESFAVGGEEPVRLGRVELPRRDRPGYDSYGYPVDAQLLVAGDRALAISQFIEKPSWQAQTRLTEIDVSDPASMAVVRTVEIEGGYVSGRLRDSTVHLAISSTPDFPRPAEDERPEESPPTGATGAAGPADPSPDESPSWLPQATSTNVAGAETAPEPLFGCDEVSYPSRFAGLGLLSVLTIDLGVGLPAVDTDVVMTNGQTVYASDVSLYIATEALQPPAPAGLVPEMPTFSPRTTIHRFDTSDPLAVDYAASGEVAGRLLSQWSMSEDDGYLRVATTTGDAWATGDGESRSAVSVLAERGGELETVGRVGGLGRGEEIYAVRFIGPIGFVVTFEQTDPLYTLDLSEPAAPSVVGELKIPGYSAYLHPAGGDLLLGIGQAGTADGTLRGSQASLFDVGKLEAPERVDQLDLAAGRWSTSATEFDHHAFLYAPDEGLAVVPVSGERFQGAVAMGVGAQGQLSELARFSERGGIERAFLVDDHLLTISRAGVSTRDVVGFEQTGSASFAGG